jgi:pyruvate kinase
VRDTKIVCTLGPASGDDETVTVLARAGMSVARVNASHGSREERRELVDRVRRADAAVDRAVAVMLDLAGPEVRVATLPEPVELEEGSSVEFVTAYGSDATSGEGATDAEAIDGGDPAAEIALSASIASAEASDAVLLDDGRVETTIERVTDGAIVARVESGGVVEGGEGVNVPGVDLGLDPVTDDDREELEMAADVAVDFVAASFVRDRADVVRVGEVLDAVDAEIPIVAKIERADAVENLEGIVDEADGVMVARGDLGVECPLESVPLIQKRVIRTCREAGVPVITATEMLDSMVHERRPTRAEAADVANAVLDGTDAVMLSGETAVGDHPVRVVETMDTIVREVERGGEYAEARERGVPPAERAKTDALARSARYLARDVGATAVVAATESGYTARKVAKYRPAIPIVAVTPDDRVRRTLALSWGVVPRYGPVAHDDAPTVVQSAVREAIEAGVAASGDTVVALAGMMTEIEGPNTTNTLKVHVAAETLASGRSVVEGFATGPVFHTDEGDLSGAPEGAVVVLPAEFDGEFTGGYDTIGGIVAADPGQTGYAAMVARELDVPMISGADLPELDAGTEVTLDAERGVVYDAAIDRGASGGR